MFNNDNIEENTTVVEEEVISTAEEVKKEELVVDATAETKAQDFETLYLEEKLQNMKLTTEINELKKQKQDFEKELNEKFICLIDKKSAEAAKILDDKTQELIKKYQDEFQSKSDFLYEKQLTELVELISQLGSIVNIDSPSPEVKNYLLGFQMFLSQFKNLLTDWNIVEIIPNINDEFNSLEMVASKTEEAGDDKKNKIIQIYTNGFKMKNRVLKLASVLVGV